MGCITRALALLIIFIFPGFALAFDGQVYVSQGPNGRIFFSGEAFTQLSHGTYPTVPFFDHFDGKALGSSGVLKLGLFQYEELKRILPEHVLKHFPVNQPAEVFYNLQPHPSTALTQAPDLLLKAHSWLEPDPVVVPPGGEYAMNVGLFGGGSGAGRNLLQDGSFTPPASRLLVDLRNAAAWETWVEHNPRDTFYVTDGPYGVPAEVVSFGASYDAGPVDRFDIYTSDIENGIARFAKEDIQVSFWVRSNRGGSLISSLRSPIDGVDLVYHTYQVGREWNYVSFDLPANQAKVQGLVGRDLRFYLISGASGSVLKFPGDWVQFSELQVRPKYNVPLSEHWALYADGLPWKNSNAVMTAHGNPAIPTANAVRITKDQSFGDMACIQFIPGGVKSISGKPVVASFWVRGSRPGSMLASMRSHADNRDFAQRYEITPEWQRVVLRFNDHIGAQLTDEALRFYLMADSRRVLAENGDWVEFAAVQLESGDEPTPFYQAKPIVEHLTFREILNRQGPPRGAYAADMTNVVHADGRLSPNTMQVVAENGQTVFPSGFSAISIVKLTAASPYDGVTPKIDIPNKPIAVTFHTVAPTDTLGPPPYRVVHAKPNIVGELLKMEIPEKNDLLFIFSQFGRGASYQVPFAYVLKALKNVGLVEPAFERLFDYVLAQPKWVVAGVNMNQTAGAGVVPAVAATVQPPAPIPTPALPTAVSSTPAAATSTTVAKRSKRPPKSNVDKLTPVTPGYLGKYLGLYTFSTKYMKPTTLSKNHYDAAVLELYSGVDPVLARTIGVLDIGLYTRDEIANLKVFSRPEIDTIFSDGVNTIRLMAHFQALPEVAINHEISINPGMGLGPGPRISKALAWGDIKDGAIELQPDDYRLVFKNGGHPATVLIADGGSRSYIHAVSVFQSPAKIGGKYDAVVTIHRARAESQTTLGDGEKVPYQQHLAFQIYSAGCKKLNGALTFKDDISSWPDSCGHNFGLLNEGRLQVTMTQLVQILLRSNLLNKPDGTKDIFLRDLFKNTRVLIE
ncbi:hypothetical protein ACWJJH_09240 [Endozoicomonadaceae bacterium StTr2]